MKSLGESLGLGDAPRCDRGEDGAGGESKVFGESLGDCAGAEDAPRTTDSGCWFGNSESLLPGNELAGGKVAHGTEGCGHDVGRNGFAHGLHGDQELKRNDKSTTTVCRRTRVFQFW